jgi:hypothetical protein
MELRTAPASPPLALPRDFRFDSAATSPYASAPSSPHGQAGTPFLTAPPSPNPFDLLPPATPRLTGGASPFDPFQYFTSAPASPRRAAAIYAHFAAEGGSGSGGRDGEDRQDDEEFQPRGSYATSVPFGWEERPGTPKAGLGGGAAWDTGFDFGTAVNTAAPEQGLTTADELFEKGRIRPLKPVLRTADGPGEKGKIRPLKPPPGLLDGGSVASSPRSPVARVGMWSPRRRSRVGSGVDFDPFAAALMEATKASSTPGGKDAKGGDAAASGSPPKKPVPRPASRCAGWRRWRLSDLLLFRSSSDGGRVNKEPDAPVKRTFAQIAAMANSKASGNGYDMVSKAKKQGNRSAAAAADGVAGCARLSPLQRLAKGLGAYSWHHGRGMAPRGTKG